MKLLDDFFQLEEINGDGICPTYLFRWTLLRCGKLFSVYLHKFVGPDWSTDLHDHPKRFWSIGLRGWYIEHTPCPHNPRPCAIVHPHEHARKWAAPWFRTFAPEHRHRLSGPTPRRPCWTIVITGRAVRAWGFWRASTWVPWRQYVRSADAARYRSCP